MSDRFEPKIVAFACTYCGYTAADLAGSMRLSYSPSLRMVQLPCSGRADPVLLLETLRAGADAVLVVGCQLGNCHFVTGNCRGKAVVAYGRELIAEAGLAPERLEFFHVAASQAARWVEVVDGMAARARALGPNPLASPSRRAGRTAPA